MARSLALVALIGLQNTDYQVLSLVRNSPDYTRLQRLLIHVIFTILKHAPYTWSTLLACIFCHVPVLVSEIFYGKIYEYFSACACSRYQALSRVGRGLGTRLIQGKPCVCVCVCVCDCQPIIILKLQLSVHLSCSVRKGGLRKLRKKLHFSAKPKSDTISRGSLTQPVRVLATVFQKRVGQNGDPQVYSPVQPEGNERATFGIRDCPCVLRRR